MLAQLTRHLPSKSETEEARDQIIDVALTKEFGWVTIGCASLHEKKMPQDHVKS